MTLLTMRQVARRLRVSLAAVRSWEQQGLLHPLQCPFCSRLSVPVDIVDRMAGDDRVAVPVGASS